MCAYVFAVLDPPVFFLKKIRAYLSSEPHIAPLGERIQCHHGAWSLGDIHRL